jgi:hypothetical protein
MSEERLLREVIFKAQGILAKYIVPDSGISDHECISRLLGLLDGPESRVALSALPEAGVRVATENDIEAIESALGMGHGAWDTVNPFNLVEECWKRLAAPQPVAVLDPSVYDETDQHIAAQKRAAPTARCAWCNKPVLECQCEPTPTAQPDRQGLVESHPDTIIAAIIKDISGRKGIGDEWDNIDVDVRNEIVAEWRTFFRVAAGGEK